jgi:hypothetical protein
MTKRKSKPHAKVGRPTDFRPEFCEQAEKLCKLGATDKQLAEFFGKSVATINTWKNEHPEFLESLKAGKDFADMAVASALYRKATGYTTEVEKVIGTGENQEIRTIKVSFEPDTTAAIFWLKNRRRDHWRDKIEHEQSGKVLLEIVRVTRQADGRST